jgi:uncharacterized protein YndB with AHSA1/START domain
MSQQHSGSIVTTLPSDREVVMTREFDAPRELVFEAHTKPEHLRRWWGRRVDTMVVCAMDFRPGGAWRYVLRDESGQEFGFHGVYREIVEPERITWTFIFDPFPDNEAGETVVFTDKNGKTALEVTTVYDSKETRDAVMQTGMEDGANETWDRLEEYVRSMA